MFSDEIIEYSHFRSIRRTYLLFVYVYLYASFPHFRSRVVSPDLWTSKSRGFDEGERLLWNLEGL